MKCLMILVAITLSLTAAAQNENVKPSTMKTVNPTSCSPACADHSAPRQLSCKLTSPEMQKRKATVIASLKSQVLEKKELKDGYSYRFVGTDKIIDELADFVKTERLCCDFFDFELKVSGDAKSAWLAITGPAGAKDFIQIELEL